MRLLSPEPARASLAHDLRACAALLRQGSRSFHAASCLLPPRVRDPAVALYAFCRVADDAVDHGGREAALAALRQRLARAYTGCPQDDPVDRAFAWAVTRFALPRALPEALLEGFEWDLQSRRYETLEALEAYAARVAGSVGAMMSVLMGGRRPEVLARACDLGIAMQLTNIARDVGEDARAGRLYLPLAWLREAGIEPEAWLARPVFSPALGAVVARLLRAADELYARSAAGIADLPVACRPGMHAARLLYAGIGREVERAGLDSVSRRAVVPAGRKLAVLPRALAAALLPSPADGSAALESARFLVESAAAAIESAAARGLTGRALWLLDLFERLERRERGVATGQPQSVNA
jgi:phytoene synthase